MLAPNRNEAQRAYVSDRRRAATSCPAGADMQELHVSAEVAPIIPVARSADFLLELTHASKSRAWCSAMLDLAVLPETSPRQANHDAFDLMLAHAAALGANGAVQALKSELKSTLRTGASISPVRSLPRADTTMSRGRISAE